MRNYEVAFIVHPDLDDTSFQEVIERVQGWITDGGGKITNVDLWGNRKLAYEIRKQTEGQYIIMQTEMAPEFCVELERNIKLQEPIMRFMISSANIEVETPKKE